MATPPNFVAGAILTAAQMNRIGLWHVKTVTGGNGAASIVVSDAFGPDFDDYLITLSGGAIATATNLRMRLGTSATNYYAGYTLTAYNTTGATFSGGDNGATYWTQVGYQGASNGADGNIHLRNPYSTLRTAMYCQHAQTSTGAGQGAIVGGGFHNSAVSYTDFTLSTVSAANWTADITITVYGYNAG